MKQAAHHVRAHPSESDHAEFHKNLFSSIHAPARRHGIQLRLE